MGESPLFGGRGFTLLTHFDLFLIVENLISDATEN